MKSIAEIIIIMYDEWQGLLVRNKVMIKADLISEVLKHLRMGNILALPTDTLYAISCDAFNKEAVQRVYDIKKRPLEKQFPIFMSCLEMASQYVYFNELSLRLANKFWPGPLTLILPLRKDSESYRFLKSFCIDDRIAIRVPNNDLIIELISSLKRPLIGTSANTSGAEPIVSYQELCSQFEDKLDLIIEGACNINLASTIALCEDNVIKILREGSLSLKILKDSFYDL